MMPRSISFHSTYVLFSKKSIPFQLAHTDTVHTYSTQTETTLAFEIHHIAFKPPLHEKPCLSSFINTKRCQSQQQKILLTKLFFLPDGLDLDDFFPENKVFIHFPGDFPMMKKKKINASRNTELKYQKSAT